VAAQLVNSLTGPVGYLLIMSGHPRMEFVNNLIILAAELAMGFLLIPRYDLQGAALAAGISISLVNIIRLGEVFLVLKMHPLSSRLWKPVAAGLVAFLPLAALKPLLGSGRPGALLVLAACGAVVFYGLILYKLNPDPEDKFVLEQVKRRMRRESARIE
jgi:O-antigen/teichoic acid export membrane protein